MCIIKKLRILNWNLLEWEVRNLFRIMLAYKGKRKIQSFFYILAIASHNTIRATK